MKCEHTTDRGTGRLTCPRALWVQLRSTLNSSQVLRCWTVCDKDAARQGTHAMVKGSRGDRKVAGTHSVGQVDLSQRTAQ